MISRVTMRKKGLAEYLKSGIRKDSPLRREEKDKVVPLYGSLSSLKQAENYTNKYKNWKNNYEHITISFSEDDEKKLNALPQYEQKTILEDIAKTMIKHRTSGYDIDNEVIAYSELHEPILKEEINYKGEKKQRRKHLHIGISYLNPLSDTKLQTAFFNNSYISQTIDEYIAKKHNLTTAKPIKNKEKPPTKLSEYRKWLMWQTEDFSTKKEVETFLKDNQLEYGYTNEKSKTKQQNLWVMWNKKKINMRGKDFTNIEILMSKNIDLSANIIGGGLEEQDQKINRIDELRTKKISQLEVILQKYYRDRTVQIQKRRSKKAQAELEKRKKDEEIKELKKDEENSILPDPDFQTTQQKIFFEQYQYQIAQKLKGFFIDTASKNTKIINKKKGIEIEDRGSEITAKGANIKEQVEIMIQIAIAKDWRLELLNIKGDEEFQKEVQKQISEILEKNKPKEKPIEIQRAMTPVQELKKEIEEKKKEVQKNKIDKELLGEIKSNLSAQIVLDHAIENFNIDAQKYSIVEEENKINNATNRQKPKNTIDFLMKECNMNISDAMELVQKLYENQKKNKNKINNKGKKSMPLNLSINSSGQPNALTEWETTQTSNYTELAQLLKTNAYSTAVFKDGYRKAENVESFNNLIIYDIDNDPLDPQITMSEAKELLEKQSISGMILPSKSHQIEKFTAGGKSKGIVDRFRIIIPTKTALSKSTTREEYREFQELTAQKLGLLEYVDRKALFDVSRYYYPSPKNAQYNITKAREVLDISSIESQAKANIVQKQKELEEKKREILRKYEERKLSSPRPRADASGSSRYNLNFVDVQNIIDTPISGVIRHFESCEEKKEGSYGYIISSDAKYSILKENIAHDFKSDETFNTLTYLQKQMNTTNLNQIAKEFESITGAEYQKVDIEAVRMAIEEALSNESVVNDRTFEDAMKQSFDVQFVKFGADSIKIADKTISLQEIGMTKRDIVDRLIANRGAKEEGEDQKQGAKKKRPSIRRRKM